MKTSRDYLIYALVTVVVCAGAAGMYDDVAVPAGGHSGGASANQAALAELPQPFPGVTRLRLVLLGADDREGEGGRSDTLMVMWLNPERKRAAIMSIPRDLRAAIPDHGTTKINAAYAFGGPPLTVRTVAELLQLPIDAYVKINFQGFVKAVDALGGVDLLVEDVEGKGRGMNYDDNWGNLHIHLTPGRHHLDGYQAMGFCRYRKSMYRGLGDGDFKRAERQQQFLRAIVEQKLRVQKLPQLLRAGREVMQCVETDLTWRQGIDLARLLKEMGPTDIKTLTIPVHDVAGAEAYFCATDEDSLRTTLAEIEQHLDGLTVGTWKAQVLNGCGVKGLATEAAEVLRSAGFEVVSTGNADNRGYDATRIRYAETDREAALAAATALGAGQLEAAAGTELQAVGQGIQLSIVVGRDFARRQDGS